MDALLRDVRYAFVVMRRNIGFSAAVLLTLALGMGATTAVFSVVYGVLLRPLPYPGGDRLVRLSEEHPGAVAMIRQPMLSNLTYHAWRQSPKTIDQLSAYSYAEYTLVLPGGSARRQARARTILPRRRRTRGCGRGARVERPGMARPFQRRSERRRTQRRRRRQTVHDRGRRATCVHVPGMESGDLDAARRAAALGGRRRRTARADVGAVGARTAQAGRDAAASRGRRNRDGAVDDPSDGRQSLVRRRRTSRRPRARPRRRNDVAAACVAARPRRGCRLRAADCVRERCEPVPVARHHD